MSHLSVARFCAPVAASIKLDMVNCSSAAGNCSSDTTGGFFVTPGFTALMIILLLIDVAAIVLKVLTATALLCKSVPIHKSLRVLLFNLLVAEILTGVSLMIKTINSAILSVSTEVPEIVPSLPLCRFIFWTLAVLLPARMFALTTYSSFVFVYIKYGKERIRTGYIVAALVIMWLFALALGVDRWVPQSLEVNYVRNVSCTPVSTSQVILPLRATSHTIWLLFGGVLPLIVGIVMPIAAYRQEKRYGQHRWMPTTAYKKSLVRLPSFLLSGNIINFVWMIIPALTFSITGFGNGMIRLNAEAILLTFFISITISLLPTPVFMLIYLRTLRYQVRKLITCYSCACCPKRQSRLLIHDAIAYHSTPYYVKFCQ